jgi:hypothetical protein
MNKDGIFNFQDNEKVKAAATHGPQVSSKVTFFSRRKQLALCNTFDSFLSTVLPVAMITS